MQAYRQLLLSASRLHLDGTRKRDKENGGDTDKRRSGKTEFFCITGERNCT